LPQLPQDISNKSSKTEFVAPKKSPRRDCQHTKNPLNKTRVDLWKTQIHQSPEISERNIHRAKHPQNKKSAKQEIHKTKNPPTRENT
jgi:hypothetical protein